MARTLTERCVRCLELDGMLIELDAALRKYDKAIDAICKGTETWKGEAFDKAKWEVLTPVLTRRYAIEGRCMCHIL